MDTILFLALLALLYYLHVRDRWWIGFAALITILFELGHALTNYRILLKQTGTDLFFLLLFPPFQLKPV